MSHFFKAPSDIARDKKNQAIVDLLKTNPADLPIPEPRAPDGAERPSDSQPVVLGPTPSATPDVEEVAPAVATTPGAAAVTAGAKQLARAVRAKDAAAVKAALDEGADVNWVNPITSIAPLHVAVKQGDLPVTQVLLEHGADPNLQTKSGWTAMHFAVNVSAHELAELLRDFGARADVVNEWLKAPSDIARDKKDERMMEILKRKAGPVVDPVALAKPKKPSSAPAGAALSMSLPPAKVAAAAPEDDEIISPRHGGATDNRVLLHKQLIRAVRSNDVKGVVAALEAGGDPEIGSSSSATRPLHIAAKHGFAEVCQTLSDHGADVNCRTKNGWAPMHFAASAGSLEAVKALLRGGALSSPANEMGRLPVDLAREKGFADIVGVLEDETDGDPEVESPRDLVPSPDDDGTPDGKALCLAVRADNYDKVVIILDMGVDVDWQSPDTKTSALHVGAKHGHTDICDLLLERGASVNLQNKAGWTPMHYAASSGFFEMVELLRSYGAHADILNKVQQSPVDLARSHGYNRIVDVLRNRPPRTGTTVQREKLTMAKEKMLSRAIFSNDEAAVVARIEEGANVNWVNPTTSIAPLHVAVKQGRVKLVRLLLERGADANIQTKAGWTALHFAATKSDYVMAALLKEFGARSDIVNEWMKAPTDIAKDKKDE